MDHEGIVCRHEKRKGQHVVGTFLFLLLEPNQPVPSNQSSDAALVSDSVFESGRCLLSRGFLGWRLLGRWFFCGGLFGCRLLSRGFLGSRFFRGGLFGCRLLSRGFFRCRFVSRRFVDHGWRRSTTAPAGTTTSHDKQAQSQKHN